MDRVDLLVVGCGPAGATAAREAARAGLETLVLERDAVVGSKRVCAAGLRPGFCETFDVPREVVHCDTPRLAFFGRRPRIRGGVRPRAYQHARGARRNHGRARRARGRADCTQSLFRTLHRDGSQVVVEYADLAAGERRRVGARYVFFAQGATAQLDSPSFGKVAMDDWRAGLLTTLQYRVYLDRPAAAVAYRTLELHYFSARDGRQIVAWMFPKRDHLAIGLGVMGKIGAEPLRAELDAFTERVRRRLYPEIGVGRIKTEGHLLYGGVPRPGVADAGVLVGGTAAGLWTRPTARAFSRPR